jgi:hypothetical protein
MDDPEPYFQLLENLELFFVDAMALMSVSVSVPWLRSRTRSS